MSAELAARTEAFVDALVDAGADLPFRDPDGLIYWCVPRWIVEAYAAARLARADVVMALATAAIGPTDAVACRSHPKAMIWTMVRDWTRRLGHLERLARGVAPATAGDRAA